MRIVLNIWKFLDLRYILLQGGAVNNFWGITNRAATNVGFFGYSIDSMLSGVYVARYADFPR